MLHFVKFQHFWKTNIYCGWQSVLPCVFLTFNRAFLSVSPGTLECPSNRALAEKCAQCSFPPRASSKDHNYLIKCKYISVSRPQLVPLTSTNQGHSSVTFIYKRYDLLGVPCWNIAKKCKNCVLDFFFNIYLSVYNQQNRTSFLIWVKSIDFLQICMGHPKPNNCNLLSMN